MTAVSHARELDESHQFFQREKQSCSPTLRILALWVFHLASSMFLQNRDGQADPTCGGREDQKPRCCSVSNGTYGQPSDRDSPQRPSLTWGYNRHRLSDANSVSQHQGQEPDVLEASDLPDLERKFLLGEILLFF